MQYDQTFHNQQCSDNSPRGVRLTCNGETLGLTAWPYRLLKDGEEFQTDLYLDEQDREALAAALVPKKFEPRPHWSEFVAFGAIGGLLVGFVSGALL